MFQLESSHAEGHVQRPSFWMDHWIKMPKMEGPLAPQTRTAFTRSSQEGPAEPRAPLCEYNLALALPQATETVSPSYGVSIYLSGPQDNPEDRANRILLTAFREKGFSERDPPPHHRAWTRTWFLPACVQSSPSQLHSLSLRTHVRNDLRCIPRLT